MDALPDLKNTCGDFCSHWHLFCLVSVILSIHKNVTNEVGLTQLLSKQTLFETCKGHPRPTHHPTERVTERRCNSFFLEFVKVLGAITVC